MTTTFQEIKATYETFANTWKTNDGASVARAFTEDGTLINPFGERADGRGAVSAMYTQYFGTLLRGTSTTIALANVRAVGTDHAFADAAQTITGADGKVVLSCHLAALLRREADGWRFVDARPYTFPKP